MAFLRILAVVLCAGTVCAAPSRIVGGSPTTVDRYPSIVQVDYLGVWSGIWGQQCAASILTSYWIVSAAHCFHGVFYDPSLRRIRAGSTFRNNGGVTVYITKEINHPTYGQHGLDGDITVVRLASALTYTPVVQQVLIAPQGTVLPHDLPVVHAGWGRTESGGNASEVLLDTTIYTIDFAICKERYDTIPLIVTENMICAGIIDVGGKDACQGDSGGPLYYGPDNILVGVVSWGRGCADAFFPGVSTAVGSYTDWIVANAV